MTSWHRGCPTPVGALRLLTLTHWGFDGRVHTGRLVVAGSQARAMLRAMRGLFEARFPIRRMELVERYGADDDRSMAADNTSGFNCRRVYPGGPWSAHAYGLAIDVNPLENPFITSSGVSPPAGAAFVDRSQRRKGMIHAHDAVVKAFAAIGWSWGGSWRSPKDYQHFSATGN
jgi:D-alanyl-D-alanine carboxypeptidase-like protein